MCSQRQLVWFRRLALAGAALAAAVVVLGAWVRLTDAGLGCPDWPGCYGHVYPHSGFDAPSGFQFSKALHEMIHRYFATALGLIILCLLAWAVRLRKDPARPLIPAVLLVAVVCLQGALGALTVTMRLKPLIVTAHLLGGLTTLGILCWLSQMPQTQVGTAREHTLRRYALIGLAVLVIQIALGGWTSTNYAAVACPDFPTCQQSWWPHMNFHDAFVLWHGADIDYEGGILANPARIAIHVAHRLGAAAAGSYLIMLGVLVAVRATRRRATAAGALLVVAVLAQIIIGVSMVHWGLPLPLATAHNAGAAFLVISLVTVLRTLWPAAAIGVLPLQRVDHSR